MIPASTRSTEYLNDSKFHLLTVSAFMSVANFCTLNANQFRDSLRLLFLAEYQGKYQEGPFDFC